MNYHLNQLAEDLLQLPDEVRESALRLAELETSLATAKAFMVPDAAKALEMATIQSTALAMENGALNGSNQQKRDVQLTLWLEMDETVLEAENNLREAKDFLLSTEYKVAEARANHRWCVDRLNVRRAIAELNAAWLQSTKE